MKTLGDYQKAYREGRSVREVLREVWEGIQADDDEGIFIYKFSWEEIEAQIRDEGALCGIPFVVKDNIDIAGFATTAACPEFSYQATETAPVIAALQDAGAVCFGKTNLDQFATGLVGVRTPYPVPRNVFDEGFLPGGSSCGSAVALARGLVAFSLGTDTAGSGRVPAAFNELVGLKPSKGYLSTRGVVDACKSLDCVSVFAHRCADADAVLRVAAQFDPEEAWSRRAPEAWPRFGETFRFGVPRLEELRFFGWEGAEKLFEDARQKFEERGGSPVEVDLEPFLEAAKLLYEGPWVAERYVALQEFIEAKPEALLPVTRGIIEGGKTANAAALFEAQYRLAECKRLASREMDKVDFMMLPTVPRNFSLEEVKNNPVELNSILGTYTNFMNLLDYCAVALPAGRYEGKLPWGITMFAEAGRDRALLEKGSFYEGQEVDYGNDWNEVRMAVCGAHLEGMALNWQLLDRGGSKVCVTKTAPCYRMYLIPEGDGLPERPALMMREDGVAIDLEVWKLTREAFGDFVSKIPGPLGIGKVLLEDGSEVSGFIAEPRAAQNAKDLSSFGGWRGYQESLG